jgi:hypothetical protein
VLWYQILTIKYGGKKESYCSDGGYLDAVGEDGERRTLSLLMM